MAKINVCDVCKKDGVLTETSRYMRIKGHSHLDVSYCAKHEKDMPKTAIGLVRLSYSLMGIELKETDAEIKQKYLAR